jgi:carboxymethylenebutenolidase
MNLFQRYLAEEFAEDYEEGRLSRREALKLITSVTGSLIAANSILAACAPPPEETATSAISPTDSPTAEAVATLDDPPTAESAAPVATSPATYGTVMPDDPAVVASEVQIPTADTNIIGYLARPAGEGVAPVILVCHENRGLTPHIQDVTRRFAKAGYVGLAVDLLSRQGGSAAVGQDNVPGALGNIAPDQFVEDFKSGWRYLQGQAFADAARVGMTGFCFGGGVTWRVATQMPELLAAVPFYGPHPSVEDVPDIQAAVLAIYGELDSRINGGIPAIEQAMMENNKIYEKIIYQGADHAFHNDTGQRYNPEAARDAWGRTLAWFEQYVRNA